MQHGLHARRVRAGGQAGYRVRSPWERFPPGVCAAPIERTSGLPPVCCLMAEHRKRGTRGGRLAKAGTLRVVQRGVNLFRRVAVWGGAVLINVAAAHTLVGLGRGECRVARKARRECRADMGVSVSQACERQRQRGWWPKQ
jgi:hypothetical protein